MAPIGYSFGSIDDQVAYQLFTLTLARTQVSFRADESLSCYFSLGSLSPTRAPNLEGRLLTFKLSVITAVVRFLTVRPFAVARHGRLPGI